jgi:hypothetical protein
MKLKNNILLIAFLLSAPSVFAQYAEDALRFSQTEQGATARFRALGNAQTALGGDVSSLSGNPAGLGMFTRSEISLTADFNNTSLNSNYLGQNSTAQVDKLGLPFAAAVWSSASRRPEGSDLNQGWLRFNFGVSYSRSNNFNNTLDYRGTNPTSSFADYIADQATNNYLRFGDPNSNSDALPAGSLEDMGFRNYLVEYDPAGYFAATDLNNEQRNVVYNTGSQGEVNFALGANYSNRFYIGASLGLTTLNYGSDREYTESGSTRTYSGQPTEFIGGTYGLSYRSYQKTTGSGVNAKLGMIYRATDNVRLGFNFVSPTWYTIDDSYSEVLDTRYTRANGSAIPEYVNSEENYPLNYTLRTPYRLNGGISFVFNNAGLITGDVEYVDYTSIHFSSSSDATTESNVNADIRDNSKSAWNFRVGGEYKLDNVSFRAGYNTRGNPYKRSDYSSATVSGGLGYRVDNFYLDLTYTNTSNKYSSQPYLISNRYPDFATTGPGEAASIKNTRSGVFLTVGTRF